MDDLILNLDFAAPERRQKKEPGSQKHRSFVRRRRELERRGVLRHKQLPPAAPGRPRRARARRSGAKPPKENGTAGPVPQNQTGRVGKARGAAGGAPPVPQNPARSKGKDRGAAGSAPPVPQNPARSKEKAQGTAGSAPLVHQNGSTGPGAPAQSKKKVQGAAGSAPVVPQNPTRSKEKARGTAGSAPPVPQNPARSKGKVQGVAGSAPPAPHKLVAMDCEMVGTGPGGRCSALARCSVVSYEGDVLYDRFVRPEEPVVDYRTRWSGVRPRHMATAAPFRAARQQVLKILAGKVVVGHAIHNDFKALHYCHPKALTRDTSQIPLLNRRAGFPENVAISLKRLTKALLNQDIQVGKGGHSSVEDARATMELYKVVEEEWEQHLQQNPEQNDTLGGSE